MWSHSQLEASGQGCAHLSAVTIPFPSPKLSALNPTSSCSSRTSFTLLSKRPLSGLQSRDALPSPGEPPIHLYTPTPFNHSPMPHLTNHSTPFFLKHAGVTPRASPTLSQSHIEPHEPLPSFLTPASCLSHSPFLGVPLFSLCPCWPSLCLLLHTAWLWSPTGWPLLSLGHS